jgi:hypothetical protein
MKYQGEHISVIPLKPDKDLKGLDMKIEFYKPMTMTEKLLKG